MQGLPVILKWHNFRSFDKALDLFKEFKFCDSDFYFLKGSKNCTVATYNFGSVYTAQSIGFILKYLLCEMTCAAEKNNLVVLC